MRPDDAVAITGVGLLVPFADDLPAFARGLAAGASGLAPLAEPVPHVSSRFADFDATRYANVRGMRIYNRTTRLAICATRLALADAGLQGRAVAPERLGLIMASTYGHLDTLVEYDRSLVENGPSRTNPALMPLALPSAPGALVALAFGAKACSLTLAEGAAGGLDALGLGARLLRQGRASACVVTSAFAPFDELVLSLARAGELADTLPAVFDRGARGCALGEAAVALVLERAGDARDNARPPLALLTGQASTFAPRPERADDALARAGHQALVRAAVRPGELALASSGANGSPARDAVHARALLALLGDADVPVAAVKSVTGETMDTSGLLAVASAIAVLQGSPAPAVRGLENPARPELHYLRQAQPVSGAHVLVTATAATGACSAAVLSRNLDAGT
jgi:3-oxoacyl-[acyl-carrier-protein] synthase II